MSAKRLSAPSADRRSGCLLLAGLPVPDPGSGALVLPACLLADRLSAADPGRTLRVPLIPPHWVRGRPDPSGPAAETVSSWLLLAEAGALPDAATLAGRCPRLPGGSASPFPAERGDDLDEADPRVLTALARALARMADEPESPFSLVLLECGPLSFFRLAALARGVPAWCAAHSGEDTPAGRAFLRELSWIRQADPGLPPPHLFREDRIGEASGRLLALPGHPAHGGEVAPWTGIRNA